MQLDKPEDNESTDCCPNSDSLLKNSSIPLLNIICQSKSNSKKILYFLVLMAFISACCFHVFNFVDVYLKYPVHTHMDVDSGLSAEFPAVTVCNLNRMKRLREEYETTTPVPGGGNMVLTERKQFSFLSDSERPSMQKLHRDLAMFYNRYSQMDDLSREKAGHQLSELVEECRFGATTCYQDNFTLFQNLQFGNCYTFNRRKDFGAPIRLKSLQVGCDFGLDLVLNVQVQDYMATTPSVGMRVVIHDPDQDPDPMESGVNVSPGFETHIALAKSTIRRLPAPYRDRCFDYKNKKDKFQFSSQLDCVRDCTQKASFFRCSCVDPFLSTELQQRKCDMKNSTETSCLDSVLEDMSKYGLPCSCPIACNIDYFKTEISSSAWSSEDELKSSLNFVPPDNFEGPSSANTSAGNETWVDYTFGGSDYHNASNQTDLVFAPPRGDQVELVDRTDLRTNTSNADSLPRQMRVKLKVFFKTFDSTVYSQSPRFSESEIISHIGGLLSLWLGLSVLAFYEFFEKAVLLMKRLFH